MHFGYTQCTQKGFAPILIVVIIALITTAIVALNKNKYQIQKETSTTTETSMQSANPSITSSPSTKPSLLLSPTKFVIKPTITPFLSPSPTQIPIATVKQVLSTTLINLGRSNNDMPAGASGNGEIKLMSIDPYISDTSKIASLQYTFSFKNLESEKEYLMNICTIDEGGNCVGLGTVRSDSSGNASYSGNAGITVSEDQPFKAIKLTQKNDGFCSNTGSPCLRGELSLEIKFE